MEIKQTKITINHLQRKAVVYLRQSTERQVKYNRESTKLQYALANHLKKLGWSDVEIIDDDLGTSAGVGSNRAGFDKLIAMVARGEVGIIASREISRFSRTDKDWCQLLEICQIFDTLIGDNEGVYDLSVLGDQLVLGIKGTLSVVELKTIQMRMMAGKLEKAKRGEYFTILPVGYQLDVLRKVVKDPDLRIQEAIELVFKKFRELWSVRKLYLWFNEEGIKLPVHSCYGVGRKIVWQLPSYAFLSAVIKNAFYAGAYIYGWEETKTIVNDGKIKKIRTKNTSPENCKIFIPDHHQCYINWDTYKENNRILTGNKVTRKSDNQGSIRKGSALLVGVLTCGSCGRKMSIQYRSKTNYYYGCVGKHGLQKYCFCFSGSKIDEKFSQEILSAISPLGIKASLQAIEQKQDQHNDKRLVFEKQFQQLQYEANRLFEQFDAVDPKNRLAAVELEKRWNSKLEEVNQTRKMLQNIAEPKVLSKLERKKIFKLGEDFTQVWCNENVSLETKKQIIRTVVRQVFVYLGTDTEILRFVIHWQGGTHTEFFIDKPLPFGRTSKKCIEVVKGMVKQYSDFEIADKLNKLGLTTGKGNPWQRKNVRSLRYAHSIPVYQEPNVFTKNQAAKYCNVSTKTIDKLVSANVVKNYAQPGTQPWKIKQEDLGSQRVQRIIQRLRETRKVIINDQDCLD
ncbi:recombinase family protein [Candidatus Uabimicrobium amorphum]|uniref:Uncharacterized protein n=1 Tax=Uabimicrobium amorphum TaxID=2596890 RepID=A0A5S9ISI3_UABAM|nr:recombinase family protein [Candidatus Uabimicrobium amorphum]BBM86340.1 hypothetical protein UABAM_04726 [Candidatus Uabimicrobium amorphum]